MRSCVSAGTMDFRLGMSYVSKKQNVSISNQDFLVCCGSCIVVLLFYVHGKHLRSCRDGQLT